jgi:N-acetylmuramoyl-L-alanine amidase CwlA
MLPIQKILIDINYSKGVFITPFYIVIHETDNTSYGANAIANRNYFANHSEAQASTHFVVDDKNIIQCAELNWKCWHVGDNKGYSDITNSNSIGIEICVNSDGDFAKAKQNAIELTKYLIAQLNIPINRVVRHYDSSGKHCPRIMLDNPQMWIDFTNQLKGDTKKMKNLVVTNNYVDKRAGEYLADYLQCPVIDGNIPFDYSVVENVYCVGGGQFTSYAKQIIKGNDRYDTMVAVLKFIGKI